MNENAIYIDYEGDNMGTIGNIAKQAKLLFFENIYTRKININLNKAIFSFTFDDVPVSAAINGAKILEDAGTTGTYYVALGMDDGSFSGKRFIDEKDIKTLHEKGHDIGCHTYSHLNLRKQGSALIEQDCIKNTNKLKSIIGNNSIEHFSYPFGMVSPWGKKVLGRKYKTLRTTDYGINNSKTDLTHLRAVSLCSRTFNRTEILETIQNAVRANGWIIFFTHDIVEKPSEWGTTIDDFKWVVDQCLNTSGRILNVSKAYDFMRM